MNQDQLEHVELLREAFDKYLMHVHEADLQPNDMMLSYDFDFLADRKWNGLAETMLGCDLRELTNLINGWGMSLKRWHAWSMVLNGHDELKACELRSEFLDSLVHKCLLRPSSIRDTLTSVATAAFHQVRLSIDRSYPDYIEGDPRTPEEKPMFFTRKQKEKRLNNLIKIWPESTLILNSLRKINTTTYINKTSDYRNLANHSIGPRLGVGETRTVTRSIEPATVFEEAEKGRFTRVNVPGKVVVSYGFGGTLPLDLETVRAANLAQYQLARSCYTEYRTLLEMTVAKIERV
tara:strand:- start:633 stop:1508 length:876 start_codon:yes stop_codon:yes gene_type:complete